MPVNPMAFNPANGLRDTVAYPSTPANEADAREQVQGRLDELKDYLNNEMVPYVNGSVIQKDGSVKMEADLDMNGKNVLNAGNLWTDTNGKSKLVANSIVTVFVDSVNGDDSNDGLTTGTAVKTLKRAIEMQPAGSYLVVRLIGSNDTNNPIEYPVNEVINIYHQTVLIQSWPAGQYVKIIINANINLHGANLMFVANADRGIRILQNVDYAFIVRHLSNIIIGAFYSIAYEIDTDQGALGVFRTSYNGLSGFCFVTLRRVDLDVLGEESAIIYSIANNGTFITKSWESSYSGDYSMTNGSTGTLNGFTTYYV